MERAGTVGGGPFPEPEGREKGREREGEREGGGGREGGHNIVLHYFLFVILTLVQPPQLRRAQVFTVCAYA